MRRFFNKALQILLVVVIGAGYIYLQSEAQSQDDSSDVGAEAVRELRDLPLPSQGTESDRVDAREAQRTEARQEERSPPRRPPGSADDRVVEKGVPGQEYTGCIVIASGEKLCGQEAVSWCGEFGMGSGYCYEVVSRAAGIADRTRFDVFAERLSRRWSRRGERCSDADPMSYRAGICLDYGEVADCVLEAEDRSEVRECVRWGRKQLAYNLCVERHRSEPDRLDTVCGRRPPEYEPWAE